MSAEGATSLGTLSDEKVMWALRNVVGRKLGDDQIAELFRRYETQVRS
jgi:hypothetical protein